MGMRTSFLQLLGVACGIVLTTGEPAQAQAATTYARLYQGNNAAAYTSGDFDELDLMVGEAATLAGGLDRVTP